MALRVQGCGGEDLFNLLLGAQVVGVATLLLVAVDSTGDAGRRKTCSVLVGELAEEGLHDATLQTKH